MTANNPAETFRTHAAYVKAFAWISADGTADRPSALREVKARFDRSCPVVNGNPRDRRDILRSLHNAWATELLLDMTASSITDDEFARLANNWISVQAYYVAYHATQALGQAKGWIRPTAHTQTQTMFHALWAQLALPLAPWGLAHTSSGWTGFPPELALRDIHPWTQCNSETSWLIAAKALRTTRKDAVFEAGERRRDQLSKTRRREWRAVEQSRMVAGKRPRREPPVRRAVLNAEERNRVADSVRPHTLIDYLYRHGWSSPLSGVG